MSQYEIRIGSRKSAPVKLNFSSLTSIVDDGLKRLIEIRDINKQYIQDSLRGKNGGPYYVVFGSVDRDLKHRGQITLQVHTKTPQQWEISIIQMLVNELDYVIAKCEGFKKSMNSISPILPGYAVSLKHSSNLEDIFEVVCSPRDSCCPKCGALVTQKSLPRHIDSNMCLTKATDNEMEATRGLTRTTDDSLERAVMKAGIEHERRPVAYATWVPKWAVEAAEKYKQGGGYAGMSLADYLKRMVPKPEDTE